MTHEKFAVVPQGSHIPAAHRRTCVLVLGMHRSGTSAFARVLNLLGCDLPGTLMGAGKGNDSGHWESQAIADFNDRLLESAGSSWDDWLPLNPSWLASPKAGQFREEALGLLDKEFGTSHLFVLKDPRICRLAHFWLNVLGARGISPKIIVPIRDPQEVAMSLAQRDGFEPAYGRLLWLRHVLDAEYASRGKTRVFATYNRLLENWSELATFAADALDLPWPRRLLQADAEIAGFLNGSLRHHETAIEDTIRNPLLTDWVRDVLGVFSQWASRGERQEDFLVLDRVRDELDGSAPAFMQLVKTNRSSMARIRTLEATVTSMRAQLEEALKISAERFERETKLQSELDNVAQQLAINSKQLTDRTVECQRLAEAAARSESDANESLRNLAELERQSSAGTERLREASEFAAAREDRLQQVQAELVAQAGKLRQVEQEFATATQQLLEGEETIARVTSELQAMALSEEASSKLLSERAAECDRLADAAALGERKIDELLQKVGELDRQSAAEAASLREANEQIADKDARLQRLEVEVVAKSGRLRQLVDECSTAKQHLLETRNTVAGLTFERDALAHAARASDHAVIGVRARLQQVENELETARKELEKQATENCEALVRATRQQEEAVAEEHQRLLMAKAQMSAEVEAIRTEKLRIEKQMTARFSEIAVLTRLIEDGRVTVKRMQGQVDWAQSIAAAILGSNGSWKGRLVESLPTAIAIGWRMRKLKEKGLFDADEYLAAHPDVLKSGMNPLRHYLVHGIREGRTVGKQMHRAFQNA